MRMTLPRWSLSLGVLLSAAAGTAALGADPIAGGSRSPLAVADAASTGPGFTALTLDADAVAALRNRSSAVIDGFPLSAAESVSLAVAPFDVFTPDARLVLGTAHGDVPMPRPDVLLLRGSVVGDAESRVFLSFSGSFVNGWVQTHGRQHVISSGPYGSGSPTVVYDAQAIPADSIILAPNRCANDGDNLLTESGKVFQATHDPAGDFVTRAGPCRSAALAIETDEEFRTNLFGGNADAAAAYAATLIGGVSDIYVRDVNTRLQIGYLRIWTTTDPWDRADTTNQLFQFQDYWNANMTGVSRVVAHYFSGRGLGGGVAYVGALCETEYDYGLSANLNGFFPYPIVNNNSQNWDPFVTAHELGHNFGTWHTHDSSQYNPVIDGCGLGDCTNANLGTIMSYCHTCSGGMENIRLEFHPRTIDVILAYEDTRPTCVPVQNCCLADFNLDGFVTGDDFDGYVAAFELGDDDADFNGDGFVTGDDFDAYVAAFEAGC